jgi:signal transduction histidine kinase
MVSRQSTTQLSTEPLRNGPMMIRFSRRLWPAWLISQRKSTSTSVCSMATGPTPSPRKGGWHWLLWLQTSQGREGYRHYRKRAPPHKDWLDLNATIRDVLALARSEVHRHGVALETHLAAEVPRVLGDRIQLQQVLLNLLMNAIEAMSGAGEGPRALWVSSERVAATEVLIAVGDSGPGFDPQSLDRLFDAFYTTKPHGLGLGLAISRRIIEAHGGRLWATANTPHGAVLQFTLPMGHEGVA